MWQPSSTAQQRPHRLQAKLNAGADDAHCNLATASMTGERINVGLKLTTCWLTRQGSHAKVRAACGSHARHRPDWLLTGWLP